MRNGSFLGVIVSALVVSGCGSDSLDGSAAMIAATPDPVVARTLNDPLMVDPDLVYRNEAYSALTIRYDHALPPHRSTTENAEAAREAARRELLVDGPMAELPVASAERMGIELAPGMTADEIIKASGAPERCLGKLDEGLVWAARMPVAATVMPHGMTMQAAGAETERCKMRIVRYVTPVDVEDVLRYHFNRANRAGMQAMRYSNPEAILSASRGSQQLRVYARAGQGGTSSVDLITWSR